MDFYELFTEDSFGKYQVKLIEELNDQVVSLMSSKEIAEASAVLDMSIKIIRLPYKLSKSDEIKRKEYENLAKFRSGWILSKMRALDESAGSE